MNPINPNDIERTKRFYSEKDETKWLPEEQEAMKKGYAFFFNVNKENFYLISKLIVSCGLSGSSMTIPATGTDENTIIKSEFAFWFDPSKITFSSLKDKYDTLKTEIEREQYNEYSGNIENDEDW